MADEEKSFKERWDALDDDEKIYVYQNLKNMGSEEGNRILQLTTPEEIKRLGYRIATGESVFVGDEKLPIPASERAKLQFARNPDISVDYLNKELPQYEFKNYFGNIVGRVRGSEDKFLPVDPEYFGGGSIADKVTEFVQDVGDVAWPLTRGTAETLSAMGGGLAGGIGGALAGPLASGAGALTGAAIAGGEATAGMSRLESDIAEKIGLVQPKPTDQEQAQDRLMGGLFSLLGGSGASIRDIRRLASMDRGMLQRIAERRGIPEKDLWRELERAQSGAPVKSVRGFQNMMFGPGASNSRAEMSLLRSRLEDIKEMEKANDPLAVLLTEKRRSLEDQLKSVREDVTQNIKNTIPDDAIVDIKGVYEAWGDEIQRLKDRPNLNQFDQEVINDLENEFYKFMSKYTDKPIVIEEYARDDLGNIIIQNDPITGARPLRKRTQTTVSTPEFLPRKIPAKDAADLVMKLRDMDQSLQRAYRMGGTVADPKAKNVEPVSRSLSRVSRKAIDYLDDKIDKVSSGDKTYTKAKKDYGDFSKLERIFYSDGILNDKKFFNIATKLTSNSTGNFRSSAAAIDNKYGTSFIPEMQNLALYQKFGKTSDPDELSSLGISSPVKNLAGMDLKRTPAGVIGGVFGWEIGSQEGVQGGDGGGLLPYGSAAAGAYLGNALTSPYFARRFMARPSIPATRLTPEIPWNVMAKPAQVAGRASDYREMSPETRKEISQYGIDVPKIAESPMGFSTPYQGGMLPPNYERPRDLFQFNWQNYQAQPFSNPGEWQQYQGLRRRNP